MVSTFEVTLNVSIFEVKCLHLFIFLLLTLFSGVYLFFKMLCKPETNLIYVLMIIDSCLGTSTQAKQWEKLVNCIDQDLYFKDCVSSMFCVQSLAIFFGGIPRVFFRSVYIVYYIIYRMFSKHAVKI